MTLLPPPSFGANQSETNSDQANLKRREEESVPFLRLPSSFHYEEAYLAVLLLLSFSLRLLPRSRPQLGQPKNIKKPKGSEPPFFFE